MVRADRETNAGKLVGILAGVLEQNVAALGGRHVQKVYRRSRPASMSTVGPVLRLFFSIVGSYTGRVLGSAYGAGRPSANLR